MKTIHAILAVIFATLFLSASFAAEEPQIKQRIEIKICDGAGADLIDIEAEDMEVGETRQSFTESGKEVLITRLEEGYQLEVDGKEIDLGLSHGGHHSIFNMFGGDASKVIIKTLGGEEGHSFAFIHSGDDEGEHHWVQDGGDVDIVIKRFSAATHLEKSGVLDDLDEETRQKIPDTLKEMEPHAGAHKRIFLDVRKELHEQHEEDQ